MPLPLGETINIQRRPLPAGGWYRLYRVLDRIGYYNCIEATEMEMCFMIMRKTNCTSSFWWPASHTVRHAKGCGEPPQHRLCLPDVNIISIHVCNRQRRRWKQGVGGTGGRPARDQSEIPGGTGQRQPRDGLEWGGGPTRPVRNQSPIPELRTACWYVLVRHATP